MDTPRIACLYISSFPLAAHVRISPELRFQPLVVHDDSSHVVAVSKPALTQGLLPGLSLSQAKSLLPLAEFKPRNVEGEKACQEALAEVADAFSPRVQEG